MSIPSGVTFLPSTAGGAVNLGANTFLDRWNYVAVTSTAAAGMYIYATADGSTASSSNGVAIAPGETVVLANQLPYWNQTRNVIQAGTIQVGNGAAYNASTNPSTPMNPGTVTPMEALDGKSISPGTIINLSAATATIQCLG
jgi:hypothetical protein